MAFAQTVRQECPVPHAAGGIGTSEGRGPALPRAPLCLAQLSCLGVTEDSFYQTANSQRLDAEQKRRWVSQRAFVALYVASHRGHLAAVKYLLEHGNSGGRRSMVTRWGLWQVERTEWLVFLVPSAMVPGPGPIHHPSWPATPRPLGP